MNRLCILGCLFYCCFSLEASQVKNNAKKNMQKSQTAYEVAVEKELMWQKIKQQTIGTQGMQIDELWVRVMYPRIGPIETAFQELQELVVTQRSVKLRIAGYCLFNYNGSIKESKINNYSAEDLVRLQPDQLLLIGLTNGEIAFLVGSAVAARYKNLRKNIQTFEALDGLVRTLFENLITGKPGLQLDETQTRIVCQAPNYVKDNIIANYKCVLAQNHEAIAKEIAAALNLAAQNQGQQPVAPVQIQPQVQVQQNQQQQQPQVQNQAQNQQAPVVPAPAPAAPAPAAPEAPVDAGGGYGGYIVGGIVIAGVCAGAWWLIFAA